MAAMILTGPWQSGQGLDVDVKYALEALRPRHGRAGFGASSTMWMNCRKPGPAKLTGNGY